MLHMVGVNSLLKCQLPSSGTGSVLKILNERITAYANEWISLEGVCRTAPAPSGLLIISKQNKKNVAMSIFKVCYVVLF